MINFGECFEGNKKLAKMKTKKIPIIDHPQLGWSGKACLRR